MECMGPKDGVPFNPRCGAPAAYTTPLGGRCAACAKREMDAIRDGSSMLAIFGKARGKTTEQLLSGYRPLS